VNLKERFFGSAENLVERAKENIRQLKRTVKAYSPSTILQKGYAIITINDKIIIDPEKIHPGTEIKTILRDELIYSTVTKKSINEYDL
jgi:exodeoxyribonuclease VII large subunit